MIPLDLLVSVLVVAAMGSVGLDVDAKRLESVRATRRLLPAIFLVNYVGVPVVALGPAALLLVHAQVCEGVLLCALAPGGASATLIAARMRADAAVAAAVVIATTATSVVLTHRSSPVLGGGDASMMFAVAGRAHGAGLSGSAPHPRRARGQAEARRGIGHSRGVGHGGRHGGEGDDGGAGRLVGPARLRWRPAHHHHRSQDPPRPWHRHEAEPSPPAPNDPGQSWR